MHTRRSILKTGTAIGTVGAAGLAGCLGDDDDDVGDDTDDDDGVDDGDDDDDPVRVAWVHNEPIADIGWVNTHEETRIALEEEYGDQIETTVIEDIAAGEARETFEDLAEQGYDVIEAATFDYGTPATQVIDEYDDVYIETPRLAPVEGYEQHEQKGYYLGKLEDPCYAIGRAAAMVSETQTIGVVQSFNIPSTMTELNAIIQGARSVDPDMEMEVRVVNTWFDPPLEIDAAESLVDEGADVLGYRVSAPNSLEVAEDNDIWGFGYADDFKGTDIEYDKYMTSRAWNWYPFHSMTVQHAIDGTLFTDTDRFELEEIHGNYWGFPGGGVDLGGYGDELPDDVIDDMEDTKAAIEDGEITDEDIFEGTKYEDWTAFERVSETDEYVAGIDVEEED